MGTFRFVLAVLVMLSHFPGVFFPPAYIMGGYGQVAVLGFYAISGWLMCHSYQRFQAKTSTPVASFFTDRFIKLWPSYILVYVLSVLFLEITSVRDLDIHRLVLEVFLIPAAFTKMLPWGENALTVIPPSWSLGVEACFYLAVPLLALLSYRAKVVALYAMAICHNIILSIGNPISDVTRQALGVEHISPIRESWFTIPISDYFGMDFPFFVGTVFLMGFLAFDRFINRRSTDHHILIVWAIYLVHFIAVGPFTGTLANLSSYEVLFTVSFGMPLCLYVAMSSWKTKAPRFDVILGQLSYPLFLTHFLARYIVEYSLGPMSADKTRLLAAIILSLAFAAIVTYWQKIVDEYRYKARGFESLSKTSEGNP